jgi:hypothetical protein
MIFARRGIEIDAYPAIKSHLEQFRERLEPKPKGWSGGRWTGRKPGPYKWYEIQDSVDYWQLFEQPKILYPDITWRSSFSVDPEGRYFFNNTVYFLPSDSEWLIAIFNSPLMWSYCWRNAAHGKDEALRFFNEFVQRIPIAAPKDEVRVEAEEAVGRLISFARSGQEARRDTLDWLRVEFGVEKPGQKLEDFATLGPDAFVDEVRKRRPKGEGRLTPGALRDLKGGYAEMAGPVRQERSEAAGLERRLSDLVNEAYGLTGEEVDLMWKTAPPRMPRFL